MIRGCLGGQGVRTTPERAVPQFCGLWGGPGWREARFSPHMDIGLRTIEGQEEAVLPARLKKSGQCVILRGVFGSKPHGICE